MSMSDWSKKLAQFELCSCRPQASRASSRSTLNQVETFLGIGATPLNRWKKDERLVILDFPGKLSETTVNASKLSFETLFGRYREGLRFWS